MAKMFYTLEEVCEKLGKSEEEVKNMASSGQLQEFRDRDKLMFKVDQIDLRHVHHGCGALQHRCARVAVAARCRAAHVPDLRHLAAAAAGAP